MTSLIGLAIIVLVIWIIFQISRASELVRIIKNQEADEGTSNKINASLFLFFLIFGMIGAIWTSIYYAPMYLPEPASEHGMWIRSMFFWTLVPTAIVFVITHIMLFWFAYKYQHSTKRNSVHFADSHTLEIIWTAIPAVVMVGLVVVGLVNWFKIFSPATPDTRIVEATAMQFKWELRYSGKDNELGSKSVWDISSENGFGLDLEDPAGKDDFKSDTLYLEVNKPVLMKLNSLDVLHSFYLPQFRVKMDCVPGIPTQFKFTPTKTTEQYREQIGNGKFDYELACAELCGQSHWNMRKLVKVVERDEYVAWWQRNSVKTLFEQMGAEVDNIVEENEPLLAKETDRTETELKSENK